MALLTRSIKKYKAMRILLLAMGLPIFAACSAAGLFRGYERFDGQRALSLVAEQLAFGPRIPGTPEIEDTRQWIEKQLSESGWRSRRECFQHAGVQLCNLIAKPVDDSSSEGRRIVLGAHYDTRRMADLDPDFPSHPVPGANDGASGVAVLLELARVLNPSSLESDLTLYFFDGEDQGNLEGWDWSVGARYAAEQLNSTPAVVVIVDMVGDRDLELFIERNSTRILADEIWSTAGGLGYESFIPEPKYSIIDDHIPFLQKGIDVVEIIDFDYPAWHTTGDTLDKVSAESLFEIGHTLQVWLQEQ
jgi:hypothetical protein